MTSDLTNRTHGLVGTYTSGCRCDLCREAKRQYTTSNIRQRGHRMARQRMAVWVRENYPDVYQRYIDEAIAELKATR